MVLAGPLDLVQGGQGLIGRFPVAISNGGESNRYWGVVSAVIDVERLYQDSGLLSSALDIDVAISGRDGLGEDGALFYGNSAIKAADPVEVSLFLPGGSWVISAVPKGGWVDTPPNAWLIRTLVLIGGLFILVPMFISGRLIEERKRNIQVLENNKDQLQELSHRLKIALDASQIGIWELDIASGKLLWDDRMKELYGLRQNANEVYEDWRDALHPDDLQRAELEFSNALHHGASYVSQFRVRHPGGRIRHIRTVGSTYTGAGGKGKIVGVNWDVTLDVEKDRAA